MKKGIITNMLPIMVIVTIIMIVGFIFGHLQGEKADRENPMCEDVKPSEGHRKYGCCLDCHKLDMSFMKHDFSSGFFGADVSNCYCVDKDKEVKQIW